MEHFLDFTERLRRLPEPMRRQLLWLSVFVISGIIAIAWTMTLRWQFSAFEAKSSGNVTQQKHETLPGIRESLARSVGTARAELKAGLRSLLLVDNPEDTNSEESSVSDEEKSQEPQEIFPRLPSR